MKSKLSLSQRLEIIRRYQAGEKASDLCRKYGISRVLFYRILSRFEKSGGQASAVAPKRAKPYRYGRQLTPRLEQKIIAYSLKFPQKSVGQIHQAIGGGLGVSRHAIQNVLLRYSLNDREKRL